MKNEVSEENLHLLPAVCAFPPDRLSASGRQVVRVFDKVHSYGAKVHSYGAKVHS